MIWNGIGMTWNGFAESSSRLYSMSPPAGFDHSESSGSGSSTGQAESSGSGSSTARSWVR